MPQVHHEEADQKEFISPISKFVSGTGDNIYPFSKQFLSNIREEHDHNDLDHLGTDNHPGNFSFHDPPAPTLQRATSTSFSWDFKPMPIQLGSNSIIGIEPRKVSESIATPPLASKGTSVVLTDKK